MDDAFLDWLGEQISRYDRMVDSTEFPVDQIAYNEVAHALRQARDKYKELRQKTNEKLPTVDR